MPTRSVQPASSALSGAATPGAFRNDLSVAPEGDHRIAGTRLAVVSNSVLVVGRGESHAARSQLRHNAGDRIVDGPLDDDEHLLVRVMMRRMRLLSGRELRFMSVYRKSRVCRAVQDVARNVGAGGTRRQILEAVSVRTNSFSLGAGGYCREGRNEPREISP